MIDPKEELLSLGTLARRIQKTDGCTVNPSSVFRWATKGLRGHKLEIVRIVGRMLTSWEAFHRFNEAVNSGRTKTPTQAPQSPRQQKRIRNAEKVLADAGIA